MSLELFHFLRPYWLWLLPVLAVLLWLMIFRRLGSRSWEAICDSRLLPYMLIGGSSRSRAVPIFLVGVSALISILSLAGPVWEKLPQPVFNNQTALVIALDLSHSMDSNDISPSRLERARFKVADILNQHGEGQAALLVYAGDAFTVTPLTDDMATIASQLPALATGIMPSQGNRTDLALLKAEELLKGAGHSTGDILLVTDEIDLPRLESQARELKQNGYRISVLGIGTEHGAPVVKYDGSFLKDRRGEIVIPVLDDLPMRELAKMAGGNYRKMTPDDSDIQFLLNGISQNANKQQGSVSEFETDVWHEQGPWLVLLLIPLAALAFRRGYLIVLVILIMPIPDTAQAFEWESLWLRADQRAKRELDAGNSQAATELFNDPSWKGAAQYRAGDFQATVDSLEAIEDVEARYNKGNALARLGQFEEAIASYNQVLELMPEHEDAQHNKTLLEEELEKQQQQDKQQSQQDKDQKKEDGEQQQESQDQDQQGEPSEQEKDQQQQEQESNEEKQKNKTEQEQELTEEEKQKLEEEKAKEKQQKAEQEEKELEEKEQQEQLAQASPEEIDEEQQATEQWLRRIPDDPAGLLRRKFRYQYQQRKNQQGTEEKTW
ncbi:MAG: Ca-activated chloride channel family protein [Planctomycetota bacterium]|jgi:Ca-activated chloride channel family protein